jgi:NADPH:quinone reductase-like Zn-dependent oxidoreductase
MKALRFERTGSLEALQLQEVDHPRLQPGGVLVRVKAATINPSDTKNVLGKMSRTTLPRIPGRDFAGIVVEGPAESIGREVFGSGGDLGFGRDGTHAEFVAVPAAVLVDKPKALSFAQAAALGVAHLTAWAGLVKAANLQPGESVLVTGVTGAVGSAVAHLARWLKAGRVYGVVRRATARSEGSPVDVYLNLEAGNLSAALMAATENRGVNVVFDAVGGPLFEPCLRCLAHGGRQVAITSTGDGQVSFNLRDFYHREARLFGADSLALSLEESADILRALLPGFESGLFPPPEVELCPLEEAPQAYRRVEEGKAAGKIAIVP